MAIEAMKQTADPEREIKGFCIQNVIFHTALRISSTIDGTEVQLHLSPEPDTQIESAGWTKFTAYYHENEQWIETCRGAIQIEFFTDSNKLGDRELNSEAEYHHQLHESVAGLCTKSLESQNLYRRFREGGNDYGPAFRRLENIHISNGNEAKAEAKLFEWGNDNYPQAHVIHPASLDGLSQLVLASLCSSHKDAIPARVVTEIRKMWVSSSGLSHPTTTSVHAVAQSLLKGPQLAESTISVLDSTGNHLRLHMEGLRLSTVTDHSRVDGTIGDEVQHLCYHLDWKPDVELSDHQLAKDWFEKARLERPEPAGFYEDLTFLIFMFLSQTLNKLGQEELSETAPHLQKYMSWMRLQLNRYDTQDLPYSLSSWKALLEDTTYLSKFCDRMENINCQGKLYVTVGRNIIGILRGEIDPLDLFFKTDLLKDAYQEINSDIDCFPMLGRFLDSLTHKNPGMRFLEIGAGTGGATVPILNYLRGAAEPRYALYDFTDISISFFEKAKEVFSTCKRINFGVFDAEKDPVGQGFDAESYDVVIAANVQPQTLPGAFECFC